MPDGGWVAIHPGFGRYSGGMRTRSGRMPVHHDGGGMQGGTRIGFMVLASLFLVPVQTARAAALDGILYEGDSIYHHITIRQDGRERCMIFGRHLDLRQTCMDLDRPDVSVFEYSAMMFAGFLFRPDANRICLIGLGGGYIPTVFRMHLPRVRLQIVEVDPFVEKLAKEFFHFRLPPGQALAIEDGRQFLRRSRERYDQIWLDAFNSDYIPAHLTTREFLQLVRSRLTTGGIVIQNLFGGNQFYDAQIATFRSVFSRVFVFEGQRSGSCVIVASDAAALGPEQLRKQAKAQAGKIGRIDLAAEAAKCRVASAGPDAPILTDDFNPANLLLMQKN